METIEDSPKRPHRRGRIIVAVVALLLLLALVLTPPMLNLTRYQKRIVSTMSTSLGRTVHLNSAKLRLLPRPGLVLENLVVSEDPAFGTEPTIRAMKVVATLRVSSLWRRQVEFSKIQFVVDDNGSAPSLNLVRNAQGHWNLESLLMHASRIDAAPTSQAKAGPAPRFPYIEATGARVNVKLGAEKMPFSLTETDFAMWLPSSQQWSVRLEGKPARTDNNVSDPGVVRVEGSFNKAPTLAEVPADMHASWRDAPLGEASLLLTGKDAGWRGTLHLDVALTGLLGQGQLHTHVTLNNLRRADFVPDTPLDLSFDCNGELDVTTALVHDPGCQMDSPRLSAVADTLDLTSRRAIGMRVGSPGVPEAWVLNWARLFSQRLPADEKGLGTVSGTMVVTPAGATTPAAWPGGVWTGKIEGDVGLKVPGAVVDKDLPKPRFTITSDEAGAVLEPLNLMPPGKTPPLMLSGTATRTGYTLMLVGSATAEQFAALAAQARPLADGLDEAVPQLKAASDAKSTKAISVNVSCTRVWGGPQTCVETAPIAAKPRAKTKRRR
ncbi:MAG: AsmA family protein [Acidobacteriota bacterium]